MRVFLLGPGYYEGEESRRALHDRLRLAESLAPHKISIMEFDEDQEAPVEKFEAIMARTDEVVVWLPRRGKLNTVFGELLLLRKDKAWHGRLIWVFAEDGVLDASSDQFRVLHPAGQIAFLLDLPKHYEVRVFEYRTLDDAERLMRMYAGGALA